MLTPKPYSEGRLEEIRRNGFAYCTYISERSPTIWDGHMGRKTCFENRTLILLIESSHGSGSCLEEATLTQIFAQ